MGSPGPGNTSKAMPISSTVPPTNATTSFFICDNDTRLLAHARRDNVNRLSMLQINTWREK
jgi:hypothetical protein